MDLTNEQWAVVQPLIPQVPKREDGQGRPRVNDRAILDGVLWIMRTGAPWKDMPDRSPSYQTNHRRFQQWDQAGVFETILRVLAGDLKDRGDLDLTECFIDGSVIAKRGLGVGKNKRGKGTKIMAVADGAGLPVAISISSASPHEVRLTEDVLEARFVEERLYCMVMKFKDGQVSELYEYYDQMSLMTQLGLM